MQQQVFFKTIIQGRLEFGNTRSYEKIMQLYAQRMETIHKKDVIFKNPELIFNQEDFSLNLNRFIGNVTEKTWKNTISLLEYCAQFSLAGNINAWLTENGKILAHYAIEPTGEKTSVILYQEGKKMSEQKGSEQEAIKLLTEAIEKYERHSQAYEKRGYMNYHLKNYSDAIYDFKKSINFDAMNASSHYGLGRAYMIKQNYQDAIPSFEETIKNSIALQPIYWAARRVKGNSHLELKEYDKAATEYKFFVARNFATDDPNIKHLPMVWFNYGKSLFALGQVDQALEAFDKSLLLDEEQVKSQKAEMHMHRGIARKAAGKSDYILDLKIAAELGLDSATQMLSEIA